MRWLSIVFLLAGCDSSFDPTGTYVGDATRTGQVSEVLSFDGTSGTTNSTAFNHSFSGIHAVVTRAGEGLIDVELGDFCRVRARQGVGNGERETVILDDPAQNCPLDLRAFTGPARVSGTIDFDAGNSGGITVQMTGNGSSSADPDAPGHKDVTFAYSFQGQRAE